MVGCAEEAPTPTPTPTPKPEPITLKAVSFLPGFIPAVQPLGLFAEKVNEQSKGELIETKGPKKRYEV